MGMNNSSHAGPCAFFNYERLTCLFAFLLTKSARSEAQRSNGVAVLRQDLLARVGGGMVWGRGAIAH